MKSMHEVRRDGVLNKSEKSYDLTVCSLIGWSHRRCSSWCALMAGRSGEGMVRGSRR